MKYLTWNDFDLCIDSISNQLNGKKYSGVYGVPRGGLCLAVAISHKLKIELLLKPKPNCMVIDDVYETGKTLEEFSNKSNIDTYVWVSKVKPTWWKAIKLVSLKDWLIFPWENQDHAHLDQLKYYESRINK